MTLDETCVHSKHVCQASGVTQCHLDPGDSEGARLGGVSVPSQAGNERKQKSQYVQAGEPWNEGRGERATEGTGEVLLRWASYIFSSCTCCRDSDGVVSGSNREHKA